MPNEPTRRDNRSIPSSDVIPVLEYSSVPEAVEWICRVFGFTERLRIADHRVQLTYGNGAMVVRDMTNREAGAPLRHSLLIRVSDAHAHHARAVAAGAEVVSPPTDYPYGERQYSVLDIGGHRWTFSETITDSDPASWGGELLV